MLDEGLIVEIGFVVAVETETDSVVVCNDDEVGTGEDNPVGEGVKVAVLEAGET